MSVLRPRLSLAQLGKLYTELGGVLQAGLSMDQGLTLIGKDSNTQTIAEAIRRQMRGGSPLSRAMLDLGLLSAADEAALHAGESAGTLANVLNQIGSRYQASATRARGIKARMTLPAVLIILTIFITPIAALTAGRISFGSYLTQVILSLTLLGLAAALLWRIPAWLRGHRFGDALDTWRLRFPVLGRVHQRAEVLRVIESLELLYTAGVPITQALKLSADTTGNGIVGASFHDVLRSVEAGTPLENALATNRYLSERGKALLRAGNLSGRLSEMLQKFCALESQALEQTEQTIADWIPRIAYFLVIGWMASRLL